MKDINYDEFSSFIQMCMDEGMHRLFDSHYDFFEACFAIFDEKDKRENENYTDKI